MADSDIITDAQIAAARAAGAKTLVRPRAVAARYLAGRDRIEIDLATGWSVQVPRSFLLDRTQLRHSVAPINNLHCIVSGYKTSLARDRAT